jgi:hypothetical protein
MTVLMTPGADFRMAEESTAVISSNAIPDPMALIDQLP